MNTNRYLRTPWVRFGGVLGVLSLTSVGFWYSAAQANGSYDYWYLLWNLFLAWLPFIFGLGLLASTRRFGWRSSKTIILGVLWFGFLPNAFYMVTDYVHLQEYLRSDVMLDIAMFTMFVLTGLALGFSSVLMVHRALRQKLARNHTVGLLAAAFLLCSFALYLGRELRWNTWDLLSNPFGIVFNVSDMVIHPGAHPQAFQTTAIFFVFLSILYIAIYRTSKLITK